MLGFRRSSAYNDDGLSDGAVSRHVPKFSCIGYLDTSHVSDIADHIVHVCAWRVHRSVIGRKESEQGHLPLGLQITHEWREIRGGGMDNIFLR